MKWGQNVWTYFPNVWTYVFQMTGPEFCQNKWLVQQELKNVPCFLCHSFGQGVGEKGQGQGAGKARCGCEMVGNHVRLDGDDTAQSPRPVHVFCSNNFA